MYQVADACQSWYQDGSAQTGSAGRISCVYGAISTLVTVAGALFLGAQTVAAIGFILSVIPHKRDLTIANHGALLLDYQTTMVNYTGLAMAPMFNNDGELMVHNKSGMPLLFGCKPSLSSSLHSLSFAT